MSIFIDKSTTLVVQGITGRDGSFHTKQMIEYGTRVVAGVTPGKGGQKFEDSVPIFNTVAEAFKIILSDPSVRAVFINIFGGIMQCDVLAQGVVDAAKEVNVGIPLVVRLEGTNVEKGREIIAKSGLAIISADGMTDGARKAVEAAGKAV